MISTLAFPVYKIRAFNKLYEEDNITYIDTYYGKYVIDNKNLKGDTLGLRRLRINREHIYKLRYKLSNIIGFIGQKTSTGTYIDNTGMIFRYKKTTNVKITYHQISSIDYIEGLGASLNVLGISVPLLISSSIVTEKYVGLLNWLGGYLIYELTNEKKRNTTLKI